MSRLSVQVVTYAPTVYRHCQHCEVAFQGVGLGERIHKEAAKDALPPDLIDEFQQVSDWVHGLRERHGNRVAISIIDAASIEGVWKSLRHGVRRYPAVIIEGREKRIGPDFRAADEMIDERLRARPGTGSDTGRKEVS